jgi:hypothetical protein
MSLATKQPCPLYLPELIQLSHTNEKATRTAAVESLAGINQPAAREQLSTLLNSNDESIRWVAATSLLALGDNRALEAIASIAITPREHAAVRPELELLALYPDEPVATDAIASALRSTDPYLRAAAIHALNAGGWRVDPLGRCPPPPWMVSMTSQQAMQMLLDASEFDVISSTTAASPSKLVVAFRLIATTSSSNAAENHLLQKGTPAGKLYGLCKLFIDDQSAARRMADQFVSEHSEIKLVDGLTTTTGPIANVTRRVLNGELPARLIKIYASESPSTAPSATARSQDRSR